MPKPWLEDWCYLSDNGPAAGFYRWAGYLMYGEGLVWVHRGPTLESVKRQIETYCRAYRGGQMPRFVMGLEGSTPWEATRGATADAGSTPASSTSEQEAKDE